MSMKPATVPHTCTRRPSEPGSWDIGTDCDTCVAIDGVWQLGYDTGRATGNAFARMEAYSAARHDTVVTFVRYLLLGFAIAFAIDAIARNQHTDAAE